MLWADWSPGYDTEQDVPAREGRTARPGQPRRRARLLPGHARRRLRRPGAGRPAGGHPAGSDRSRRCTCTAPTTAASAPRWPSAPRSTSPDNISVRIFDGCGHFLHVEHPQADQRRDHGVPVMTTTELPPNRVDQAGAARRPRRRRQGGVRVLPDGGARCSPASAPPCTRRTTRRSRPTSPPIHDADLAVSWHHDIETVPTLIRVERRRGGRAHRRLAARGLAADHRHRRPRRRPAGDAARAADP